METVHAERARTEPAKIELARRELARRHFADYLEYAGRGGWIRTRMAEFLATETERFIETDTGHAYDVLVINCPPQHGKSMTITESLPSWYLGRHPDRNVIIASYDSDFAEKFCRRNKEKIRSCGRQLFGVEIGAVDRAAEFELTAAGSSAAVGGPGGAGAAAGGLCGCRRGGGRLIARGIMSGITGNPANLVIIDDPVKNQLEADSPTYRQRLWGEWQASIKSRLAAGAKVIIIMTPWREDVFDREVIRTEANVRHICLPVEAYGPDCCRVTPKDGDAADGADGQDAEYKDPLGRAPGEPLCPELGKDAAWLKEFRASYIDDPLGGQRAWAAMFMCSPRVQDGNLVKRDWWRYYRPEEISEYGSALISVDAAFKGDETSDFVSIQVWGKLGTDYYLRYCLNRRLDFPETVQAIRSTRALYPDARTVIVEEAANGAAIIATLQREMFVIPITPNGGKVSRVNAVSAAIESGHVYVPEPGCCPWVNDFLEQFATFPNAKHDDMVDAASQALHRMIYSSGERNTPAAEDGSAGFEAMFDVYG